MAPVQFRFTAAVNVRTAPSTDAEIVAVYQPGQVVTVDGMTCAGGYVWGRYTGATSGQDRFVALGPARLGYAVEV